MKGGVIKKMAFKLIEPISWKPESPGDEIIGVLLRVEDEAGKYKSKVYHLETEDGKQLSIFGSAVLKDKLGYISIGDKIKIVFKGEVEGKDSKYKDFEVYKDFQE